MPVTPEQTAAIKEVISAITAVTGAPRKRRLVEMFMELVDREAWPQYYQYVPAPRSIEDTQRSLDANKYHNAIDVYTDLSLVFWNALFYNESGSQIAEDAKTLKVLLDREWRQRSILPPPRSNSPPPNSGQKVHNLPWREELQEEEEEEEAPPAPTPAAAKAPSVQPSTPAPAPVQSRPIEPQPIASTSRTVFPERKVSEEVVDVEMLDPVDDYAISGPTLGSTERDPENEQIVEKLEKSCPPWPGFSEEGWAEDINSNRFSDIVHVIKSHKDVIGNRLALALESIPDSFTVPSASAHISVSLKQIETRTRHKSYALAKDFDKDFAMLFLRGRRYYAITSESYGRVLLLQRLYQALTSPDPPAGPHYASNTNFAALAAGPGRVRPLHSGAQSQTPMTSAAVKASPPVEGVTGPRVNEANRYTVPEVHYKGWNLRFGDWVHLSNPDDPARPIVGQVYKCWVAQEGEAGQQGVTVSWYYRPEQTFHSSLRKFWENEVFKTSHFADHPLPDVIEKVALQFTARHVRGRPRPPHWYPGFPLYVCDSRYNDRDRVFVRIKNWASCVPEDLRIGDEYMPIFPFERTVYPRRYPSPFLRSDTSGTQHPGGLLDSPEQPVASVQKRTTRRTAAPATPAATIAPTPSSYTAPPPQTAPAPASPTVDRSIITVAGGYSAMGGTVSTHKLPPETVRRFARDPATNELMWFPAPPPNAPRPKGPQHSLEYLHFLVEKRKRKRETSESMEVDGAHPPRRTVAEILRATEIEAGLQ
ncbi:hypothetical protein K525DRAFT_190786 [Schizophyllum commune Loenen D]|nr:hypothetical protein K525DRAFT_190786 [Schizophyllum commune Loenen D]